MYSHQTYAHTTYAMPQDLSRVLGTSANENHNVARDHAKCSDAQHDASLLLLNLSLPIRNPGRLLVEDNKGYNAINDVFVR